MLAKFIKLDQDQYLFDLGRPYLISEGTILRTENKSLVDNVLIY